MSLALLPFGNGQNVRILIKPLTKSNADFSLTTTGTSYSMAGKVESLADDYQLHDETLNPMDVGLDNPVTFGYSGTYTITEFESHAVGYAAGTVNVLKLCLATSYYAAIAVQLGALNGSGVWTPTTQDFAVVKFVTTGRNAPRESMKRTANFQLVPYVDASTGAFKVNPIIGDTANLASPFALLS